MSETVHYCPYCNRHSCFVATDVTDKCEAAQIAAAADEMTRLRLALAKAEKERDEKTRYIQALVAKVADNRLDGYRALGQRALDAEVAGERYRLERDAALIRAESAESRLAEAEGVLREISTHLCLLIHMGYTTTCDSARAVGPCGPCVARAFLDAAKATSAPAMQISGMHDTCDLCQRAIPDGCYAVFCGPCEDGLRAAFDGVKRAMGLPSDSCGALRRCEVKP